MRDHREGVRHQAPHREISREAGFHSRRRQKRKSVMRRVAELMERYRQAACADPSDAVK
ncbi:hypothetical cytosolic protein [Syntrophus aciditrophicus SB]|uniref:Hypothetical cytosolic protein n=1 Tax=Syntrophus aciditrophicus (strain SB) TaxID=56780 RepID=Q2LUQ2_SYNAS|nr:hypothetical cytosolic protein [Syntrophus aciditrophicus SB]